MHELWITLAQVTSQPASGPASDSFLRFMVPVFLAMGVFYFLLFRGQRKDRRRQQEMLDGIKRNDRVQTIGGLLGTVVDVREQEVVLKVDETNNVKMRFNRSAIKEILTGGGPDEAASK